MIYIGYSLLLFSKRKSVASTACILSTKETSTISLSRSWSNAKSAIVCVRNSYSTCWRTTKTSIASPKSGTTSTRSIYLKKERKKKHVEQCRIQVYVQYAHPPNPKVGRAEQFAKIIATTRMINICQIKINNYYYPYKQLKFFCR